MKYTHMGGSSPPMCKTSDKPFVLQLTLGATLDLSDRWIFDNLHFPVVMAQCRALGMLTGGWTLMTGG